MQRLRQNMLLKIFSLIASVLLYVFVQSERNPIITRPLAVFIMRQNKPPGIQVEGDQPQVNITVTGPRPLVEPIKDSDIHAFADLRGLETTEPKTMTVRLRYRVNGLSPDAQEKLVFDPTFIRYQIFPQASRRLNVTALFPKEPPAGFHYGRPDVKPNRVVITGRADRVKNVSRLVINAEPSDPGASIEGDFSVAARDADNNPVEGVTLTPDTVHLIVALVEEPAAKIVPISPSIPDLPLPPYTLLTITTKPRQIRVKGRPDRLNQISTIGTEDISVRDLTDNQNIDAHLIIPPDIVATDISGHPLTQVTVRVTIRRSPAQNAPITPPSLQNPLAKEGVQ